MSFDIGLTGIRAADTDLRVTGNNIANASTTGFKRSRAEFGDVYASTIVGATGNTPGSGVGLTDVKQQFTQGNISFTDNALDLAINGGGFFILSDRGDPSFSRSGMFSLDKDGFVVNNSGFNLQGYRADDDGNIVDGVLADLQISTGSQEPSQTTEVSIQLNLDATETPPEDAVFTTTGSTQTLAISNGAVATAPNLRVNGTTPGDLTIQTVVSTDTITFDPATFTNAPVSQISQFINTESQNNNYGVSATANTALRLDTLTTNDGDVYNIAVKSSAGAIPTSIAVTLATPGGTTPSHLQQVVNAINDANLAGLSATLDTTNSTIDIRSSNGDDIILDGFVGNLNPLTVDGDGDLVPLTPPPVPVVMANTDYYTISGEINLTVEDGVTVSDPTTPPAVDPFWGGLAINSSFAFNPDDPDTYNSATSVTIYDSLGFAHVMTQYFVKQRTDPLDPDGSANTWDMYVQIDGEDIGNPVSGSDQPTQRVFTLQFGNDGTLQPTSDLDLPITNWTPLDENGNYNGALRPRNQDVPPFENDPPTSSNFVIEVTGTTQFGSPFTVSQIDQDGFTTGRLTGLNVDDEGFIFARFSNGQAQVVGQVALAGFTNEQGLQQVGDTAWAETFESGLPLPGAPQSGALGAIQSGALEESNVDISEELVGLIIAQRNYQSNAKTIETADQVTQTILNI
ncbi:flagellar hook-basal body complex protein [Pseudomaricurvus alkylphenolicus]|uniref:flagellar hook-basal body complex protein n=1 Tax=Pseudomaricurvus alkylphenolicus TaxID=1306991 RepID=UPI001420931F|nr:flagellar hook-basal body complex protein [Pseudomaricurvus alkylphenolicus]NIB43257.1 flagellar hook-basal body complex protein [Pseudomaricurvus alkylphenolicus]